MQLSEWLSLMKEVVMCNKNLCLKVHSKSTVLQAKLEFLPERRVWIRPQASTNEKKRNILVNLSLGKSYRYVITFVHA